MVSKDYLSVYHYNATSISGTEKLNEFNHSFSGEVYDFISLTETWLHEGIFDNEILPNCSYSIHRHNRDKLNSHKNGGGGAMLCIHKSLPSIRRHSIRRHTASAEIVWVEIPHSPGRKAYIATFYMPKPKLSVLQAFEESIAKLNHIVKPNDTVIILGDWNLNDISWVKSPEYDHAIVENRDDLCGISEQFINILAYGGLKQYNVNATTELSSRDRSEVNSHVLDLVVANDINNIKITTVTNATNSTHQALEITLPLKVNIKEEKNQRTAYNFKAADWDHIFRLLSCIMWCDWSSFSSVDDAFDYFYDVLYAVIKESIPTYKVKARKFPSWYSAELRNLVKLKDRARRSFIRTGRNKLSASYNLFSQLRKDIKVKQKLCYSAFLSKLECNIRKNSNRFWSHVKSQKAGGSIPRIMSYKDKTYDTIDSIADVFSIFFKSVFIPYDFNHTPHCTSVNTPIFDIPLITPADVKNILCSLEPTTSTGSDNIPAVFVVRCADHLSKPLADLFNMLLYLGEYPSVLKKDHVVPIYKRKGKKTEIESYRGISLQPIFAKVFEGFVNKSLRLHIDRFIIQNQHGFLPFKSCNSNLLSYTDFITKTFDRKCQTHSIYTDFRKAFDLVPHHLLLLKLKKQFGVQGIVNNWFQSYLSDRYQRVVIKGVHSDWFAVTSGVPQGSILGPTLFMMYINDVLSSIKYSELLLFADDAKLFKEISSLSDCLLLQHDINSFHSWCNVWCMQLSIDKCFTMNFSLKRKYDIIFDYKINNVILKHVNETKDLGVYFKPNFNFSYHISKIVTKSYQMLGFMKRVTKDFTSDLCLNSLYNSLVRSRLEYCSQVWSPTCPTSIKKLESVQKRYFKYLCYKQRVMYHNYDYPSLCVIFNFSSLECRRKTSDLTFLNKVFHNKVNCSYIVGELPLRVPRRILRYNPTFNTESRLLCRKHSYLPRVLNTVNCNNLYDHLVMKEPNIFESFIKTYLT